MTLISSALLMFDAEKNNANYSHKHIGLSTKERSVEQAPPRLLTSATAVAPNTQSSTPSRLLHGLALSATVGLLRPGRGTIRPASGGRRGTSGSRL